MPDDPDRAFLTDAERALLRDPSYGVFDWQHGHRLTCSTVEVTFGVDGYQQLAEDASLGRSVGRWGARNPQLAALLDAERALDALARPAP